MSINKESLILYRVNRMKIEWNRMKSYTARCGEIAQWVVWSRVTSTGEKVPWSNEAQSLINSSKD